MATCCDLTLLAEYNAWGAQPEPPDTPVILATDTAVDLGCEEAPPEEVVPE